MATKNTASEFLFVPLTQVVDNKAFNTSYSDIFFPQEKTDGLAWGEFYPYQLIMFNVSGDKYNAIATFTLPISPSELQVRTPFAVQVSATLKGIVEEHAGAPFREISFSGTTGILPGDARPTRPKLLQPNIMETIFAGTVSATRTLTSSFNSLLAASQKKVTNPSTEPIDPINTGYFAFRMLYNFLERYSSYKRGLSTNLPNSVKDPKNLRLGLATYKEEGIWIITPREFSWRKTANDPHLYFYNFAATAWKRLTKNQYSGINSARAITPFYPIAERPNGFQEALNRMQNAVDVMYGANQVLRSIRGDLSGRLLDPLRLTTLFLKETVGVQTTLTDMPTNLRKDYQYTVVRSWNDIKDSLYQTSSNFKPIYNALKKEATAHTTITVYDPDNQSQSASIVNKFFADSIPNPDFFNSILLSNLDSPVELMDRVGEEKDIAQELQRYHFEEYRNKLLGFSEELANSLGLGSETYSRLIGQDANNTTITSIYDVEADPNSISSEQWDVLYSLQDSIQTLDALIASSTIDDRRIADSLEYVAGLAQASSIPFNIPQSKYLVPVPYDFTIEAISNVYLGDPDRWSEIATLNALRPPYIDEIGFTLQLLTNGAGNQFTVNSATNLYIGQTVRLSSSTIPVFKRRIIDIELIVDGNVLLTVDGDADLEKLEVIHSATMQAFLPGTVNSEQLIFIPSIRPATADLKTKSIPGIDDANYMAKISGIDLLLSSDGDIVVTPDGDTRLAYGMTNLVQAAKLKIATPLGSLIRHPDYGFGLQGGESVADINVQQILSSLQSQFAADDRFAGIESLNVQLKGPVLQINLSIKVAGGDVLLPVSIQVPLPT